MQLQVHGLRSSRFHVGGPFAAAAVDLQLATLVGAIQLPAAACSCLTAATTLQDGASVETSSAIVDTLKLAHNQLTSLAGLAGEHSVGPLLAPPPASLSLLCALCSIPFPSSSAPRRLALAHLGRCLTSVAGLADAVRPLVFMRSLRTLRWLDLSFNQLVEIPRVRRFTLSLLL